MAEPSPDDIKQVCDILGLSVQQAVVLLKNNQNDAARGVDAYFNDPAGALKPQPDPRAWEYQDNAPFADNDSTGAMPATRPPSRVDNHNSVVDLTNTHAQASAAVNAQDEANDPELQRAINMSLGKPEFADQENGVTGTGQQFGPATRATYETSQWAMVPTATSRELVDHPPPAKRRRIEGQPAFLRPSHDTGYLASLITIYHSIPLAREAFLLPSTNVLSYGYDSTWWSGSTDENRKSLSMQADLNADKDKINLVTEAQCLMAFLDATHRAYGGVDALSDLDAIRDFRNPASTQFSTFLEAWKDAAMSLHPQEQLTQIFSSTAVKNMDPDPPLQRDMVCLEAQVNRTPGMQLLNLLDATVWDDTAEQLDDVCISHAAEVFTMRLYDPAQQPEGLDLTAPAVWYPDRYTWALRDQTRQMRTEIQKINQQLNQLLIQQRRLGSFMIHGRPIRAREVLEAAAKASSTALEDRYGGHRPSENLEGLNVESIESHIRAILQRVDEKIAEIEQKKTELTAQIQNISMQYTEPGDDPDQPPRMKYVLQGVATKPEIMYVRQRSQDLLGLDDDSDGVRDEHQWWRIHWSQSTGSISNQVRPPMVGPLTQDHAQNSNGVWADEQSGLPYTILQVGEKDVIEAARTEHHSIVLVYANENALNFQGSPLPQALKQFVDKDNKHFAGEIREEANGSDESNTWEDEPLKEGTTTQYEREMTPMSMTTHRGEDGQPSPKRPKSSDDNWRGQDGLPSYDEAMESPVQEMQESNHNNKIGLYAEAMLEKYGQGDSKVPNEAEPGPSAAIHIERATDLPR